APAKSYLDPQAIIAAARDSKAEAVHPGYGFLSENAALVRACEKVGLIFVGATEEQLKSVGDKWRAREIAERAGLPVIPGGFVASSAEADRLADTISYPLLVKAVGGGGGRGMKRVDDP